MHKEISLKVVEVKERKKKKEDVQRIKEKKKCAVENLKKRKKKKGWSCGEKNGVFREKMKKKS